MTSLRLLATAFAAGSLFGLGLIISGMSRPEKVIGFLDIGRHWDPSLGLVMAAALAVAAPAFAWARRRGRTLDIPANRTVDRKLVAGSVLFGLGWGLIGLCPGPALVSLGFASLPGAIFVAAMIFGQKIGARYP